MKIRLYAAIALGLIGALGSGAYAWRAWHGPERRYQAGEGKPVSLESLRSVTPAPNSGYLSPGFVTFRELPVAPTTPASSARPDKRDRASEEKRERSPISEAEAERRRALALQQPVQKAHVQQLRDVSPKQRAPGVQAPPSTTVVNLLGGFDGPDISQCCGGSASVPPDPHLAVGPNHVIAVVNTAIGIYNKQGQLLNGPVLSDTFFNDPAHCNGTFDPTVEYDEGSDRFIINYDSSPNDCIAVSQTGDPTGAWNVYTFAAVSGTDFFDYPHIGVGDQAIYLGANIFGQTTFNGRVWALNKSQMYAGGTLTAPTPHDLLDGGNPTGTPTPMVLHGAPSAPGTVFIVTDDPNFSGNTFGIWQWSDPSGVAAPTLVGYADLQAATGVAANFPIDQTQLGTAFQIQANDVRTLDAEWRNGHLWLTHQMSCNVGAGPQGCARWAEVNPATAGVIQAGVVTIFGKFISFPNLAVDANDDMALGFTVMGPSRRPSVYVAARLASDPPGTLRDALEVKPGGTIYAAFDGSPGRWGDYTGMAADPDGQHLWYLGEYSKAGMAPPYVPLQDGNWGTWIQQIGFGPDDHIFAGTFDPLRASLEVHAEINLEDADTAPGLQASSSDPLALRYVVINTGQQALHGVLVTDDQLGVITCPTNQLDVGADMICDVPLSNPSDGQHTNNATVTATAADGTPVSASNPVNYATLNVLVGKRCTAHDGTGCPEPLQDAPDPSTHGTVTSSFDVVGCGTIDNVKVGLSINHTYVGDLLITLTSPNNTTVTLVNSPVNGNDDCPFDNLRALLDDGSANGNVDGQCAATTPAIFGVFQPSQPLAAFNGGTGNGTWTLTVNDVYPADTGTLNDWSLQLTCH